MTKTCDNRNNPEDQVCEWFFKLVYGKTAK